MRQLALSTLYFFVLAVGSLVTVQQSTAAPGHGLAIPLGEMQTYLRGIKDLSQWPVVSKLPYPEDLSAEPAPETVKKIFAELVLAVFGDARAIELKACLDCRLTADYSAKTVYVQPSYVQEILSNPGYTAPLDLIRFCLAHEIGHFISEFSVHSNNGKTINGFPSLIASAEYFATNHQAYFGVHSEIDVYGLLILKQSGFSLPQDVPLFFSSAANDKDLVEKYPIVREEALFRLKVFESVAPRIWPNGTIEKRRMTR